MAEYTKGKWFANADTDDGKEYFMLVDYTPADLPPNFSGFAGGVICKVNNQIKEHVHNADLIAAAPDIFEALESLVELAQGNEVLIDGEWGDCRKRDELWRDGVMPKEIVNALAAIAKAKGESRVSKN